MKNSTRAIQLASSKARTAARIALVALPCLIAFNAHAATATSNFTTVLNVNSPTCTVSTTSATVTLPTAGSQTQTVANYLSTNSISVTSPNGTGWVTSAAFNQTATIACTTASTPITSFIVSPATGFVPYNGTPTQAFLTDAAATPAKAAGGGIALSYEQVSVNGAAAPQSYGAASLNPYTTIFQTAAVANGTATVVWRPALLAVTSSAAMGTPAGGSYSSPGQITVNY